MSVANGFAQGFGLMQGHFANQENKRRYDEQSQVNERRYRDQVTRQKEMDGLALQDRQTLADMRARELAVQNGRLGLSVNASPDELNTAAQGIAQQEQQAASAAAELKAKKMMLEFENLRRTGRMSDHEYKVKTQEYNNQQAAIAYQLALDGHDLSDEQANYLQNSVFAGYYKKSSKLKEMEQWFDKYQGLKNEFDIIEYANHPKTLEYINDLMDNELYTRRHTHPDKNFRIVEIDFPGGMLTPVIEVTDKRTGEVLSVGPATQGMTSEEQDPLSQVGIQDFKAAIQDRMSAMRDLRDNPALRRYFHGGDEKGIVLGANSMLVDRSTGATLAQNKNEMVPVSAVYRRISDIEKLLFDQFTAWELSPQQKAALEQELVSLRSQLPGQNRVEQPAPNPPSNAPRNNAGQNAAMGVGSQDMIQLLEQLKAEGKI